MQQAVCVRRKNEDLKKREIPPRSKHTTINTKAQQQPGDPTTSRRLATKQADSPSSSASVDSGRVEISHVQISLAISENHKSYTCTAIHSRHTYRLIQ